MNSTLSLPHRQQWGAINEERTSRRASSKSTGSGEISHPRFLHLVRRDALRRHCSLDCILAPLLRVRLPLGLLSRRRRHIDVRQHLHAAVGPGDVPDHVVGDAALLRVLARVRRCQDTQGGGRISRCANGKPCALCVLLASGQARSPLGASTVARTPGLSACHGTTGASRSGEAGLQVRARAPQRSWPRWSCTAPGWQQPWP